MKALLLTHRVPYPPDRGDRIRSYHLLRFLASRADVSLACTTEEAVSSTDRQHLESLCERVEIRPTSTVGRATRSAWSLARGKSATEGYFWHPQLAATLEAWSRRQEFDVIICYCSGMYRYTRLPYLANVPIVVDLVDVDSQKWKDCAESARFPRRWIYNIEAQRICQLEREIAVQASAITVISEEERAAFARVAPNAEVKVIPNGVDLDYYRPCIEMSAVEPNTLCFVGVLNYQPNVDGLCWFVETVWPRVKNAVPSARFLIVGKAPIAAVRRLADQRGVELHADVPDVRPFLARSAVVVIPLRIARGVQNKVLEAFAAGKPVVASPQALKGLEAIPAEHVCKAESPTQWTNEITFLLAIARERQRIGLAGLSFVEQHHRWDCCLQPLAELLQAIGGPTSDGPGPQVRRNALMGSEA